MKEEIEKNDEYFMGLAISEAYKASLYEVGTNPRVGAIVVKDGNIISSGYHKKFGENHAEVNALLNLDDKVLDGATLYVTLEPCSHVGKTPSCAKRIVNTKIKRVVIGSIDPNPIVSGNGIKILKEGGIDVSIGVLKDSCDEIIKEFSYSIISKKTYVIMKYGMTMDGKISTSSGKSKWITSDKSRSDVHRLRSHIPSIMVGVNTIVSDDPMLNCRINPDDYDINHMNYGRDFTGKTSTHSPTRIVVDTNLSTPINSKVVETANIYRTIIATCTENEEKIAAYKKYGVNILNVEKNCGRVDIDDLLHKLYKIGISTILLEGGGELNWSFLNTGNVQEVHSYIAPKLLGGKYAKTPITGEGFDDPNIDVNMDIFSIDKIGDNIKIVLRKNKVLL